MSLLASPKPWRRRGSMAIFNNQRQNKQMNTLNEKSIVVGVDVHKYGHSAVAMNAWGKECGRIDFSNANLLAYTDWLGEMGEKENIIVGLEDVNSYGVHIVKELRRDNWHIRYVPAILTERERKKSS